ncbi:MAG: agmatine deiminase [Clostridia bacterium]|nr:agmatine deiminase [Clostridia bacterium]
MIPIDLNFKMPPEWAEHARTFIEWPVKEAMCWPENCDEVYAGFAEVARAIAQFEPVTMLVNPDGREMAKRLCGPAVEILEVEHNDSWMRDNGPTFVVNQRGEVAGINWKFNAWGEKYSPWDLDDQVAPKLLEHLVVPRFDAPLVMEGGSIHVDGEGTLLTTEECLLNKNRNPHLSREEIEDLVKKYLNIEKIIWLKRGLEGDETDGHVDNVACFARPGQVIIQTCSDPGDPNFELTQENLDIINSTTDARGRKLEIIKINQPPATFYQGKRLTLSYLNFYFVNKGIILPVFGEGFSEVDYAAQETLQKVFPDRRIVKVDGMSLVKEGGNVHCITQQMPAGTPAKL